MTTPADREENLDLSSEAIVLLVIVAGFCWFALFVFSRAATLDFSVLYAAGGVIAEGHRRQLFDLATQAEFQRRVLGMHSPLPFMHLAYEALIYAPLAVLPFRVALWVWRLLSFGMLVACSRLLSMVFPVRLAHTVLLAAALFPVALTIVQGQDSLLLLLLFSASLAALRRDRDDVAGLLLACASFKPQLVLPLAAVLLWKRGTRFARGFFGGCAAVLLVSLGVTGRSGSRAMLSLMSYAGSGAGDEIGATAWARPNLRGSIDLLGLSPKATVEVTVALSVILLMAVAWRLRHRDDVCDLFPPMIALTLIVSLNVNLHDFSLLLIPVLAMLEAGSRRSYLCVGACYCMPILMFLGHLAFFLLLVAVLIVTMTTVSAEEKQQRAVNA